MTDTTTLETKGAGGETARAFEEFLEAFEAFKETNDQRLAEIEQRGASDALVEEKLARIEETRPDVIVSSNMGCIGHLQSGTQVPVRHWIEVVDERLQGS